MIKEKDAEKGRAAARIDESKARTGRSKDTAVKKMPKLRIERATESNGPIADRNRSSQSPEQAIRPVKTRIGWSTSKSRPPKPGNQAMEQQPL